MKTQATGLIALLVAGSLVTGLLVGASGERTSISTSMGTTTVTVSTPSLTTTTVTDTTTIPTTVYAPSPPNSIPADSCITPIANGENVTLVSTSLFSGTMVSYGNGSRMVIPENSCPQPISNSTYYYEGITAPSWSKVLTDNYQLAEAAATNQTFIHDENGSTYYYSQPDSSPFSTNSADAIDSSGFYYDFTVIFYHYSNQSQDWCGSPGDSRLVVQSGIEVTFSAYFGSTWDLKDPTIQMMSSGDLGLENTCVISGW